MNVRLRKLLANIHDDRGTVAVSFLLCLPIFLFVVAVIVQWALLVNAKIAVDHAAHLMARDAMVTLPVDERIESINHIEKLFDAPQLYLAGISPKSPLSPDAEGFDMKDALQRCGVPVGESFPQRYTYAQSASFINDQREPTFPVDPYYNQPSHEVTLTLKYKYYLTVPGAQRVIGTRQTVAGLDGYFFDITSTVKVQLSHGREAFSSQ